MTTPPRIARITKAGIVNAGIVTPRLATIAEAGIAKATITKAEIAKAGIAAARSSTVVTTTPARTAKLCREEPGTNRSPSRAKPAYSPGIHHAASYELRAARHTAEPPQEPPLPKPSQATPAYGPGLHRAASRAAEPRQWELGSHRPPSLLQVGLWSRTMPSCGGRCRASGNLSPSTCPTLSQTYSRLTCTKIAINDIMAVTTLRPRT